MDFVSDVNGTKHGADRYTLSMYLFKKCQSRFYQSLASAFIMCHLFVLALLNESFILALLDESFALELINMSHPYWQC